MKKKRFAGSFLLLAALLTAPISAASAEKLEIDDSATATMRPDSWIRDVLLENVGKKVVLRGWGEDRVEGVITTVGDNLVYVSKTAGHDFYDAIVDINSIHAIWLKTRDK